MNPNEQGKIITTLHGRLKTINTFDLGHLALQKTRQSNDQFTLTQDQSRVDQQSQNRTTLNIFYKSKLYWFYIMMPNKTSPLPYFLIKIRLPLIISWFFVTAIKIAFGIILSTHPTK